LEVEDEVPCSSAAEAEARLRRIHASRQTTNMRSLGEFARKRTRFRSACCDCLFRVRALEIHAWWWRRLGLLNMRPLQVGRLFGFRKPFGKIVRLGGPFVYALAMALEPARLTDFRLLGPLGSGATARVYDAIHIASQTPVAIKVLSAPDAAIAHELRERFAREALVLAGIRSRYARY
jgi:hypothetical protein